MDKIEIPYFENKKDLFKFLKTNKARIEAQKKFTIKHGDGVPFDNLFLDAKTNTLKANIPMATPPDQLKVRAIINTTNILDSCKDVHLPGLWKKSLSENKMIMHVQEHNMNFQSIISDGNDLIAYTKTYTWQDLGMNYMGLTEALVFDSVVKAAGKNARNPYMFEQYSKGYVKNHSVCMQYVSMVLCVNEPNDEEYGAEYEAWQKYAPKIINQEAAIESGYFWAIKEAKVIEGSAVPIGANTVTPTLDNNLKREPGDHSPDEPDDSTHKEIINYNYLSDKFKLVNN